MDGGRSDHLVDKTPVQHQEWVAENVDQKFRFKTKWRA